MTVDTESSERQLQFIQIRDTEQRRPPAPSADEVHVGGDLVLREFFGRSDEPSRPGPQGYLVETYPVRSRSGAHFHPIDQFQIFFPADQAYYQRHPIDSIMVHYADAFVTYGPFGTGDQPMAFYTLRPRGSTLTGYMPRARDRMEWRGRRNIHASVSEHLAEPRRRRETTLVTLIEPHADGLAAYIMGAGPSTSMTVPTGPVGSAGQYLCILKGTVVDGGTAYEAHSLGWNDDLTQEIELRAGAAGFDVLVLQFPVPTSNPQHSAA